MASGEPTPHSQGPVPTEKLEEIASSACQSAFEGVETYQHDDTTDWNSKIIKSILNALLSETSTEGKQPRYKFAVTSTIIQHTSATEAADSPDGTVGGKRGMHSATGGYWNEEKDGIFNYKHVEDLKGFDVVIVVLWISTT